MVSIFSTCYVFVIGLSAVSGTLPGEKAYLEARKFERVAKYHDAQTAHQECLKAGGPLAPYALMGLARCRSRGGDRPEGIEDYRALLEAYPDGPWVGTALAEMAESLRLEKRFPEAAEAYFRILAQPLPSYWQDRYRWLAVECLVENPQTKPRAFDLCRVLCAEARSSRVRLDAAKVLAESAEPNDVFEAAYAMVKSGAYTEASKLLPKGNEAKHEPFGSPVEDENKTDRRERRSHTGSHTGGPTLAGTGVFDAGESAEGRWAYLRGRVLLGLRHAEKGQALLAGIAAAHPDTRWARLALMHLARSLYRGGNRAEGKAMLE
ncbi:MAG: tetratricopeptide repeat protein, partial [Candidatus Hydrogenedentes bacterium]|nr:tetratricopeptide repeat protein [Candidatus Hydrogenedentota bacterium]